MIDDIPKKRRWPRSQRFLLSPKGQEAEQLYRSVIVSARDTGGRASFDEARKSWADTHKVQPDDGLYLGEVSSGPKALEQLVAALDDCGKTKADAIDALERLCDAGLVQAP